MNENMHSYKSNLIIKSIYEISQKLGNIYPIPIPKKYKINKSLKEKKIIIFVCFTILTTLLVIILKIYFKNK